MQADTARTRSKAFCTVPLEYSFAMEAEASNTTATRAFSRSICFFWSEICTFCLSRLILPFTGEGSFTPALSADGAAGDSVSSTVTP